MPYFLTPSALDDYEVVLRGLAERAGTWRWSLELEERLLDTFDLLAQHPGLGHSRTDLVSREICFFPVDRYLVLYLPKTSPLKIVAILHSARDIAAILNER